MHAEQSIKNLVKNNGRSEKSLKSGDYPVYSNVEFCQNNEMSPGDLLSLRFHWKGTANAGVKNPQQSKIMTASKGWNVNESFIN